MAIELPTPCQLLRARDWLLSGAPAAHRDFDAKEAVNTLCQLISALPAVVPIYRYGSQESVAALLDCEAAEDKAEAVKTAVSALTVELWGDPKHPPDPRDTWEIDRMYELVKALAGIVGVKVPEWA